MYILASMKNVASASLYLTWNQDRFGSRIFFLQQCFVYPYALPCFCCFVLGVLVRWHCVSFKLRCAFHLHFGRCALFTVVVFFFPNSCFSIWVLMEYYIAGVVSGAVAWYLPPGKVVRILAWKSIRRWTIIYINENKQNAPTVKFERVATTSLEPMNIKQNDSLRCAACDRIIEML